MLSELDNYLQRIEDLRGQVRDLIADLPAEALNWRPIPLSDPAPPALSEDGGGGAEESGELTNSLAVLAAHIAGAEHFWIGEVVGGRPPTRDRDAEFLTEVKDSSQLVGLLEQTGQETREILTSLTAADLDGVREARGRQVPVRWGILHIIDHTALHLGHMQLTYQLWMGGPSGRSPRWFERLDIGD
ncbi:MAG: DinB family protein [Anaerolineae bacterium]